VETISILTVPALWAFLVAFVFLNDGARGTHRRYVYRTVQTPMIPLTLLNQASQCILNVQEGFPVSYTFFVINVFNLWWIGMYAVKFFRSDDDDDWWKKTGRRAKRALRRVLSARVLSPQQPLPASTQ